MKVILPDEFGGFPPKNFPFSNMRHGIRETIGKRVMTGERTEAKLESCHGISCQN